MSVGVFLLVFLYTLIPNRTFASPAFIPNNNPSNSVIGPLGPTTDAANASLKLYCGDTNGSEGVAADFEAAIKHACPHHLSKGIRESMARPSKSGPFYYIRVERNKTREEPACSKRTCYSALKAAFERCRSTPKTIHRSGVAERSCGTFSWALVPPEDEHVFRAKLQNERDARKQSLVAERILKQCKPGKLSGTFPQRQNCRSQCQEECLCRKQFGSGGQEECYCPCRKVSGVESQG